MRVPNTAIELRNVGKRFIKYEDTPMLLTSAMRLRPKTRRERLWAVRGVDMDITDGETFGVIGRNGSGKTTLMSMMAGVTAPSEGSVKVWGRVAPLIAVGVGFHRELTGLENIYVNGMILGMSRAEIDERLQDIIDFSEIGPFIDTPVKFYSSGMFVRLGFAVAVHCDPDVLIVDEVLAVGDIAFQIKCHERMEAIKANGTTVVMVSHNLGAVRRMCNRVMLLEHGAVQYVGDPAEAIARFHEILATGPVETGPARPGEIGIEGGVVQIVSADVVAAGRPDRHVDHGAEVELHLRVLPEQDLDGLVVGFSVSSQDGVAIYSDSSGLQTTGPLRAGVEADLFASFPANLPTGTYTVGASLLRPDYKTVVAVSTPATFFVNGRSTVSGVADLGATFRTEVRHPVSDSEAAS